MLKKGLTTLLTEFYVYITALSGDNGCEVEIHCQVILKSYKSFDFQTKMSYTHVRYYTISVRQTRQAGNKTSASSKAVLFKHFCLWILFKTSISRNPTTLFELVIRQSKKKI
jgi:hypothetical protein